MCAKTAAVVRKKTGRRTCRGLPRMETKSRVWAELKSWSWISSTHSASSGRGGVGDSASHCHWRATLCPEQAGREHSGGLDEGIPGLTGPRVPLIRQLWLPCIFSAPLQSHPGALGIPLARGCAPVPCHLAENTLEKICFESFLSPARHVPRQRLCLPVGARVSRGLGQKLATCAHFVVL